MIRSLSIIAVTIVGCFVWTGCAESGPPLGTVTGQVTMDGKPLANVAVVFMPATGGGTASGQTDANGNYELYYADRKGAPLGRNAVAVTTVQKSKEAVAEISSDSEEYAKQASGAGGAEYNVRFVEPIPEKYNVKTELSQEVKSGKNVINLELKSS